MSPERESRTAAPARLLNFGCGTAFHPEWTNLDAAPVSPEIIAHDLRSGFPFAAETFDAVYGSHVLEHLEPEAGAQLLQECFRVLKPGGVVRIVVPDLETIARLYLQALEGALSGDADARMRYEWLMLELYDQATRGRSGGAMAAYLRRPPDERAARFVAGRIGAEASGAVAPGSARWPVPTRIARRARSAASSLGRMLASACARLFMGSEGSAALHEGIFRRSGELHRWMYDRFSLAQALRQAGFADARVRSADDSDIPGFARYGLEARDGTSRKPDSLYIEARKPGLT
jgi:SAM-dependent methyltransferase